MKSEKRNESKKSSQKNIMLSHSITIVNNIQDISTIGEGDLLQLLVLPWRW